MPKKSVRKPRGIKTSGRVSKENGAPNVQMEPVQPICQPKVLESNNEATGLPNATLVSQVSSKKMREQGQQFYFTENTSARYAQK